MRKSFLGIGLFFFCLLSDVTLLVSVWAQAPRESKIVFVSDRDGNDEIYVMDVYGKNLRNLTKHPAYDFEPDWFDPKVTYGIYPAGKHRDLWGWLKH